MKDSYTKESYSVQLDLPPFERGFGGWWVGGGGGGVAGGGGKRLDGVGVLSHFMVYPFNVRKMGTLSREATLINCFVLF